MRQLTPLALLLTMLLTTLLGLSCPAPAAAGERPPAEPPRLIEVEGSGEVSLTPSVGSAALSVEATAPSAGKALGLAATATNHVMETLRPRLTEADRLTTEGYDLFPLYEADKGGRSRLTGYRAVSRLNLAVAGPKRLGELLDAAVAAGASGLSGVSFSNPDTDQARREAAALALKDARGLAERLAAAAGVRLGRLMTLSTASAAPGPRPMRYLGVMAAAAAPAPPIEPGELKVRVSVQAAYEIAP